jgi:hypothetical protein
MRPQAFRSEVAAGRITRFILTRLCCSQILSIQNLFQTPFSEIRVWTPGRLGRLGAFAPSPAYCCPDFPQGAVWYPVAVLLPKTWSIVAFLSVKGKLLDLKCVAADASIPVTVVDHKFCLV